MPKEYIQWIEMLYHNARSHVRCGTGVTNEFPINAGVNQSSVLLLLLFIIVMDAFNHDSQKAVPWTLLCADDVFLAAPIGTNYRMVPTGCKRDYNNTCWG